MGGIVIASTGVVVFYLALPDEVVSLRGKKMQLAQHVLLGEGAGLLISSERSPLHPSISELEFLYLRQREREREREWRRREAEREQEPGSGRLPPMQSTIDRLSDKSPEHFTTVVKEMLTPASFGDVLSDHVTRAIRPFGILIFIEGIAWFLLRQYRALMEDYKAFHRGYIRRVNILVAFKILHDNPNPPQAVLALAGALWTEDLSGRLKKDETTENLEGIRAIEPNPIFAMVHQVVSKLSPMNDSAEKLKKDDAGKET
jgi:hypothetical protein